MYLVSAAITGGSGFTFPVFNGDESVKFEKAADDIRLFIRTDEKSEWVSIDNNADSGWNECPDPVDMIAVCKYWYEKFGAVPAV